MSIESTLLAVSMASALLSGHLETFHALSQAPEASGEVIGKAIDLYTFFQPRR